MFSLEIRKTEHVGPVLSDHPYCGFHLICDGIHIQISISIERVIGFSGECRKVLEELAGFPASLGFFGIVVQYRPGNGFG